MDLKSGHPFWAVKNGLLQAFPPLRDDHRCDVAVIGGGITGALIADALAAGFSELEIEAHTLIKLGGSPLEVEGGILDDECRELFEEWKQLKQSLAY